MKPMHLAAQLSPTNHFFREHVNALAGNAPALWLRSERRLGRFRDSNASAL